MAHVLWRGIGVLLIGALLVLAGGYVYGKLTSTVYRTELSGSMRPLLQPGDLLAIQQVPARDVRVGDVVSLVRADHHGELVTHRLVALGRDRASGKLRFTTKGDANSTADTPGLIAGDLPVGRYRFKLPWLGRASSWVSTRPYRIALVWVGVLVLFAPELRRRKTAA